MLHFAAVFGCSWGRGGGGLCTSTRGVKWVWWKGVESAHWRSDGCLRGVGHACVMDVALTWKVNALMALAPINSPCCAQRSQCSCASCTRRGTPLTRPLGLKAGDMSLRMLRWSSKVRTATDLRPSSNATPRGQSSVHQNRQVWSTSQQECLHHPIATGNDYGSDQGN